MSIYNYIKNKIDFMYVAPALLCNVALLSGIIPAAFCLDSAVFAKISVIIFILSIILHVIILFQWAKYKNSSPLAYGIIQPCLHLVIMVIALSVGTTSVCVEKELTAEEEYQLLRSYEFKFKEP